MDIKINSVHFDADARLLDFINQKVSKLEQFSDDIISAEVFLRIENAQDMENKIAEIKLNMPGNGLFAKKQSKSFEEAVDLSAEAVRKQIKKHKEKLRKT